MREVTPERTQWRDLELSKRHRKWGKNCPMVDIDFLVVEYDRARAKAIVEYKHEDAPPEQYASRANYLTLIDLGNRAGLPVLVARYAADFSWFWVTPLNDLARAFVPEADRLSEREWVELLYRLRGRSMPEGLFDLMNIEC
jgi:hypothetical protein